MMFKQFLLLSSLVLKLSTALSTPAVHARDISYSATPIPPSQDPWYTAPPNFEDTSPGTILRLRIAPGNIPSIIINCSQAYHLLFRTTNALYQPSWAVTTLYVPLSASNSSSSGQSLLSYQIPY